MQKYFVLDANILLHDPQSVFHFADNVVVIPIGVISEIDQFKKEMSDRGYNARAVVRLLDALRHERTLAEGAPLEDGGLLRVYCEPGGAYDRRNGSVDNEILRVAEQLRDDDPGKPVVIVTKDINLRIRADAAGLRAEDYESDRVQLNERLQQSFELEVDSSELGRLSSAGELALQNGLRRDDLGPNDYALVRCNNGQKTTVLARVAPEGDRLIKIREADGGLLGVRPRNKEQYFAVDALLDDAVQMVTLMGKAGTGKTLLAIAAGLYKTLRRKQFRKVLIARPVIPVGRDLGYLPGDLDKKLEPWMKPITDTIEFILHVNGPLHGHADALGLMRSGLIEIQPLTYIRGRSIANRYVIVDEAQNLTPLEVKTVITRMGNDAKIVLTGDPHQIDNPYVDANSNGFSALINRFRAQPMTAHVHLVKGERSPLAELAANLL